jgi:uncharacterized damage-inducible protein DinB
VAEEVEEQVITTNTEEDQAVASTPLTTVEVVAVHQVAVHRGNITHIIRIAKRGKSPRKRTYLI